MSTSTNPPNEFLNIVLFSGKPAPLALVRPGFGAAGKIIAA
jgi:hypothetical protein